MQLVIDNFSFYLEKIGKNEKITQVFDHSCNINVRLDFIEFINPYLFTKK